MLFRSGAIGNRLNVGKRKNLGLMLSEMDTIEPRFGMGDTVSSLTCQCCITCSYLLAKNDLVCRCFTCSCIERAVLLKAPCSMWTHLFIIEPRLLTYPPSSVDNGRDRVVFDACFGRGTDALRRLVVKTPSSWRRSLVKEHHLFLRTQL